MADLARVLGAVGEAEEARRGKRKGLGFAERWGGEGFGGNGGRKWRIEGSRVLVERKGEG